MAQRDFSSQDFIYEHYDIGASENIAEGDNVGQNGAVCRQFQQGDTFLGIAYRARDNSTGAAAVAGLEVPVLVEGTVRNLTVTGAATTTVVGTPVYTSGPTGYTLTASNNTQVGVVNKGTGTNTADVFVQGEGRRT